MESNDFNKQQGIMIKCIYCKLIFKELFTQNVNEIVCLKCNNQGEVLVESRMMNKESSDNKIIEDVIYFFNNRGLDFINKKNFDEESLIMVKNQLYSLIQKIFIYQFDLMSVLIVLYKKIEKENLM